MNIETPTNKQYVTYTRRTFVVRLHRNSDLYYYREYFTHIIHLLYFTWNWSRSWCRRMSTLMERFCISFGRQEEGRYPNRIEETSHTLCAMFYYDATARSPRMDNKLKSPPGVWIEYLTEYRPRHPIRKISVRFKTFIRHHKHITARIN